MIKIKYLVLNKQLSIKVALVGLTTARHLKKIVDLKLFEDAAFQLHKVVGDHDSE